MALANLRTLDRYVDNAEDILNEGRWEAEDNIGMAVREIRAARQIIAIARPLLAGAPPDHAQLKVAFEAYDKLAAPAARRRGRCGLDGKAGRKALPPSLPYPKMVLPIDTPAREAEAAA